MAWKVTYSSKARKQLRKIDPNIVASVLSLVMDIEDRGPVRGDWPNFSKINRGASFHCHIKKGKPTYVVCWQLIGKNSKQIEVYYVGTHEKAPY